MIHEIVWPSSYDNVSFFWYLPNFFSLYNSSSSVILYSNCLGIIVFDTPIPFYMVFFPSPSIPKGKPFNIWELFTCLEVLNDGVILYMQPFVL